MEPAATAVFTAGGADIQTESINGPGSLQLTRLSVIQVGPRGGVKVVGAVLTDDQRRELIENLGGTVLDS